MIAKGLFCAGFSGKKCCLRAIEKPPDQGRLMICYLCESDDFKRNCMVGATVIPAQYRIVTLILQDILQEVRFPFDVNQGFAEVGTISYRLSQRKN